MYHEEMYNVEITYNKEKKLWEVRRNGKIVASSSEPCAICKQYCGCDFDGNRCSVLS